jgi:hypothetical protein
VTLERLHTLSRLGGVSEEHFLSPPLPYREEEDNVNLSYLFSILVKSVFYENATRKPKDTFVSHLLPTSKKVGKVCKVSIGFLSTLELLLAEALPTASQFSFFIFREALPVKVLQRLGP